jgi:uncharacterized protein (DUF1684 family)
MAYRPTTDRDRLAEPATVHTPALDEFAPLPTPPDARHSVATGLLVAAIAVGAFAFLAGCSDSRAEEPPAHLAVAEPAWRDSLTAWQASRHAEIAGPDGWSTVAALAWLDEQAHLSVGTRATDDVRLADGHAPATLGAFDVKAHRVTFTPAQDADVRVADSAIITPLVLRSDASPGTPPTVLTTGSVTLRVIERAGRLALRVKDSLADARVRFAGLDYFAPAPAWRIPARLEPGTPGDSAEVLNIVGQRERYARPGTLVFRAAGREHRLQALLQPGETHRYYVIFRDSTSTDATYPSGRFLYVPAAGADGWTVIDFNRAFNPPCAFTAFATCPIPPRENVLALRIEAGERRYAPTSSSAPPAAAPARASSAPAAAATAAECRRGSAPCSTG